MYVGKSVWNYLLLSMYMKLNVTHLDSAALCLHGPRHGYISGMDRHKASLMHGVDTLMLTFIPRNIFVKIMCENFVRFCM